MKDSNVNFEAMKKGLLELNELKHILRKTQVFFEEVKSDKICCVFFVCLFYDYHQLMTYSID
jgi:hypothetical protein